MIDIQRAAIVVLLTISKRKFVIISVHSRPPNITKTAKIFIQTPFTIIAIKSESKKQNITENYVANILSPIELLLSTVRYTLKFPMIIYTACKKSKILIGSKLFLKFV